MTRTISVALTFSLAVAMTAAANIINMRCEYLTDPLGIDTTNPRLTWEYQKQALPEKCVVEVSDDAKFRTLHRYEPETPWMCRVSIDSIPGRRYYWRVISFDKNGRKHVSEPATFEAGKFSSYQWSARWISDSHDVTYEPAPFFRRRFKLHTNPNDSRAYISALGYYDMYINGRRVSDHHMDPGFTGYDKRSLYVEHDVTALLHKGDNEVIVTLGNGFANCQSRDAWGQEKAPWRTRPQFICEIHNAGQQVVVTDGGWETACGPVIYNNLYSGEHYDARIQPTDWTEVKLCVAPNATLRAQSMPAIRPIRNVTPRLLKSWGDTIHVFDMGMNIAGVCRMDVKGETGTRIHLAHGELLKDDGRLEQGNLDIYYHPLKDDEAFQTDVYILSGGKGVESYQPQFTYHGFRYVEVRCDRPISADNIKLTGLMMRAALERNGSFKCSDELLNRIYDATMLSYEDNIHSIPTDCPQREKNGWTADAHVAIDLALLNYDGITFYEKWMNDFADNQLDNGNISGIIPSGGWGYGDSPGPVWDAGLFIIPLALYDYYGDTTAITRMYPVMNRYMQWLGNLEKEDGTLVCGIGDWLPYSTQTPTDFTSTLYAYADYKMMGRICRILGKPVAEWDCKAETMRERINCKWFDASKALYANGSQAAQAIALYWDVTPDGHEARVAANLDSLVRNNGYALDFGLLGSKSVLRMLTKYGYTDTAFRMATRTEAPSWGYWIDKCDYTTLAETWTLSPEFRDASLNHVFFGDIAAWMTNDIAGLNFDSDTPGFESVIIRPVFFDALDWVEAEYHSVRGRIASRWERNRNGTIKLSVTLPAGVSATLHLPGRNTETITGSAVIEI